MAASNEIAFGFDLNPLAFRKMEEIEHLKDFTADQLAQHLITCDVLTPAEVDELESKSSKFIIVYGCSSK